MVFLLAQPFEGLNMQYRKMHLENQQLELCFKKLLTAMLCFYKKEGFVSIDTQRS